MTSVGARRCGQNGARRARRHDRRALDEVGGAIKERRARGSARARRRRVGSGEPARGDGRAATKLSVRMTSVGARRCGRNGARGARRHDRRALDEVGGAIKERRARGSAHARRRRVGSGEPARRWKSSNEAEREDGVGRRSAVRPGRRTRRTTTRSARARRGRRRDQGTTCSRLGARSPSSCRLG